MVHSCNSCTREVEAAESGVQDQSWLHGPAWHTQDPTSKQNKHTKAQY